MNSKVIIAEREFYLVDEPSRIIKLTIVAPTKEDPDFYIQMDGVDPAEYPCMFGGVDSLQAFLQTALLLKIKIEDINKKIFGGRLRWEGDPSGGLGIYNEF